MVRQTRPFRPFLYSLRPRALLRRGIICALFAGLAILESGLSGPASARQAYIVMDAATGDVLSSANADRYHPPASLTKMMVLYMAFEALKDGRITLKKRLLVSRRAARQRPSRLGLGARTRISAKDAIMAMITKSANDAAVVMAEALAGSERKFARKMTIRAREMGMTRTTFRNATGLYSRGQMSSARDMAVLARALVTDFPKQYALFATRKFNYRGRTYRNHNRLLGRYPGVDGIKTGYIRASGFNVAVSAERDGRRVIAVYLGGRSAKKRDRRVTALLNRTYRRFAAEKSAGGAKAVGAKTAAAETAAADTHAESYGWGIQVGAYYRRTTARRAIKRAVKRLPGWFGDDQTTIQPVAVKRGTVYRARLFGLTRSRAGQACRILRKKRQRCITVSPAAFALALAK